MPRGHRIGVQMWICEVPANPSGPFPNVGCGKQFFYEQELVQHMVKDHGISEKDIEHWNHELFLYEGKEDIPSSSGTNAAEIPFLHVHHNVISKETEEATHG
jgi:hypothetical protein